MKLDTLDCNNKDGTCHVVIYVYLQILLHKEFGCQPWMDATNNELTQI
jgi:hypothetical protein